MVVNVDLTSKFIRQKESKRITDRESYGKPETSPDDVWYLIDSKNNTSESDVNQKQQRLAAHTTRNSDHMTCLVQEALVGSFNSCRN